MKVRAYNPSTAELERSYISAYSNAAQANLTIKNNQKFLVGKRILVGKMGQERSELATVFTQNANGTGLVTTANLKFPHNPDDPLYVLDWDQIKYYKSSSIAGSYSQVNVQDIDVDNEDLLTIYQDDTALITDYFKVSFYNSVTLAESDLSDPIKADGYPVGSAGEVIDQVLRRVRDTQLSVLGLEEYLDLISEVNSDLMGQSHRPYRFWKDVVLLDTVAGQEYVDLPDDLLKYDYVEYRHNTPGYNNTYEITPISLEAWSRKYRDSNWTDNDRLLDVAIDEATNRLYLGPSPLTTQAGVIELRYYHLPRPVTGMAYVLQTPTSLIYRYKLMAEHYAAKAESDMDFIRLQNLYENKYGNEIVKLQRTNRLDTGTARSFAPRKIPGFRRRYHL